MHYDHKNKYISITAFANLLTYQEIDEEIIDLSLFINKYRLSEINLKRIIAYGLDLKKSYLEF